MKHAPIVRWRISLKGLLILQVYAALLCALAAVDANLAFFASFITAPALLLTWGFVARQTRPVPWRVRALVLASASALCLLSLLAAYPLGLLASVPLVNITIPIAQALEARLPGYEWQSFGLLLAMSPDVISVNSWLARKIELGYFRAVCF